jgi:peptidoglycan/xylan/chitin deacetylase (PgdA/CDA1 family)
MIKDLLSHLAAKMPAALWGAAEDCLLPYYHMVSDAPVPHVSPLYRFRSIREFKADLDYFLHGRTALSLGEFMECTREYGGPPAKSFLLTFDDGFREMHDIVAPILKAKGVPAVFFLTSATMDNRQLCHHQKIALLLSERSRPGGRFPEAEVLRRLEAAGVTGPDPVITLKSIKWSQRAVLEELGPLCGVDFDDYTRTVQPFLTTPQVQALVAQGMAIGAHSIDHPRYADIHFTEQIRQTQVSMTALMDRFAMPYRAFAFPHTDRGVYREFFDTVFEDGTVEVTFGTSAPARDSIPFSFQRFTMEKNNLPASVIVTRDRLRLLRLRAEGATVLPRS